MDKEDFKQTLIKQYSDSIEVIITESKLIYPIVVKAHSISPTHIEIDYDELDSRVRKLLIAAKIDGLDEGIIWDLLERRLPEYLDFLNTGAKVAA